MASRELTVTGQANVKKRVLLQAAAFNLGLVMRKLIGAGTPKWLVAAFAAVFAAVLTNIRVAVAAAAAKEQRNINLTWGRLHALMHRWLDRNVVSTSAC